jgi:hypothetical protein
MNPSGCVAHPADMSPHLHSTSPSAPGNTSAFDGSSPARGRTRYRARFPIMVLSFRDNHDAAVPIPAGDLFEVLGPAPDDRFTVVDVKGEEFIVFGGDLKQFAIPVPTRNERVGCEEDFREVTALLGAC